MLMKGSVKALKISRLLVIGWFRERDGLEISINLNTFNPISVSQKPNLLSVVSKEPVIKGPMNRNLLYSVVKEVVKMKREYRIEDIPSKPL